LQFSGRRLKAKSQELKAESGELHLCWMREKRAKKSP
jgi:hypothetical protein